MKIADVAELYEKILEQTRRRIVGNADIVEIIFLALIAGGHVLVEGIPGVAKTLIAQTIAETLGLDFKRVQFTPDLMPSDITGVSIFNQKTREFEFKQGPVFCNFLLCDEINRAPPKTQSALLEALQEKQATIDGVKHTLPDPFFVVATQNPIEQAGTYPLPEAQIDRFMIRVIMGAPKLEQELAMLELKNADFLAEIETVAKAEDIKLAMELVPTIKISKEILEYIARIVLKTRELESIELGASPRASLALMQLSKARAAIHGRDYVQPDDVKALVHPVLNHRLILTHEAEIDNITVDAVITEIVESVQIVL